MTLATGKGGRYRYYKCNTRIGKGNQYCRGRSVPMEKLDQIVVETLANRVCAPGRVKNMLVQLRRNVKLERNGESQQRRALIRELEALKVASERLCEAVEKGVLPESLVQQRARKLATRRQEILIELGNLRQRESLPLVTLKPGYAEAFTDVLRETLVSDKRLAKRYLRLLVAEIRLTGHELKMTGTYAALAQAVVQTKLSALGGVPSFDPKWLPDQGSNLGPAD